MTRHARNCTAGAVYTYNEKKKDAAESGYGTNAQRLGKDSVKSFDCCSLTLQPCRNPVVTKDGYLFDKEAILQYIITKKNEYSRKLKEYERLKKMEENDVTQELNRKQQECVEQFVKSGKPVNGTVEKPSTSREAKEESSISNMANGHEKKLPSFWLPSECPNAGLAKAKKPDPTIYCPVSQKVLKAKDLIDVKFTLVKDGDTKKSLIAKEARYMCPVTHDILSNAVPCAVLRPTGDVVTMECVEKLIKKDMIHPLTSQKLKEKDIIPLQRGGTGYALTNENLEGKEKRPMLQA
ncbi:putative nitric oxide synthase-interacting protein [Lucilia cuprina]|uniref:Nitric oxide synthase-interacting protein homolog n=1 Tax=Lucilia cuprina TaxID=7375 RepID=A0A0L0CQI4_LUCCU|nr:nitric oxide synthase-interacting protein homolog [Lucilia sericata]KAI8116545.1 Nitric oxide synthase-interacting protein like protein [Lucilia cuprina]KNC34628.1 putative nitric oxide synthase-interacting protein [Lucilia cuprina]